MKARVSIRIPLGLDARPLEKEQSSTEPYGPDSVSVLANLLNVELREFSDQCRSTARMEPPSQAAVDYTAKQASQPTLRNAIPQ